MSQENSNVDRFTFQIEGNTLTLDRLNEQMDEQFELIYRYYSSNQKFDIDLFKESAMKFFDQSSEVKLHDGFFNNFTILWQILIHNGSFISHILHVHVSTISRDVKVLKELSQRFVFDLAKSDLTYYYKQCIDGMDEIKREAWSLYKYGDWSQGVHLSVKEKIAALKLLKECNEAKFALLEKGPSVLNVKGMKDKLEDIQKYKDQSITYSA